MTYLGSESSTFIAKALGPWREGMGDVYKHDSAQPLSPSLKTQKLLI